MKWLLVVLAILVLTSLVDGGQKRKTHKRGKNQINRGNGKKGKQNASKKKMMKQDACTAAGHPCMIGQECVVSKYTKEERCVCIEHCPYVANAEVCGSDMKTYTTACHLYQMSCEAHRMTTAVAFGACDMYHTKHLKVEPEMAMACQNSKVIFQCQIDKMVEEITAWEKDGHVLKNSRKINIEGHEIAILHVNDMDEGNYTCVTMVNGTMRKASATLKMTQVPVATIPDNHIACQAGDQIMIPCEHTPDSEVSWMKNGFEIDENDMKIDDSGMLIMKQTDINNSGTYQCVASNFCGISKAACTVNVTIRDPNVCREGVEKLECADLCEEMECVGNPELKCQMSRCGECAFYWMDVKMMNVTCPKLEAPQIINTQLVSLTPEGDDAIITCKTTGYPTPKITWAVNGFAGLESIEGKKKHSLRGESVLVVRQVVLGQDNGRYTCTAENSQGKTDATIILAIMPRMTPMCPQQSDKIMKCEADFCATASCPAYKENVTCVNTVCNVCTYIFVDRQHNYVDCYADPKVVKMMKMNKMNMMGGMAGWPAGSMGGMGGGGGHGGMGAGAMGGSSMGAMPGWPAGSSMGGSSMGAMPGWPAGSSMGTGKSNMGSGSMAGMGSGSMAGWPAGSSMSAMPGWPNGPSMGSMPWPAAGGSGMGNMGSGSMGGMGSGSMAGWPGNMGGGHGGMSSGSMSSGGSAMDKNAWHFVPGWPGHMSQMGATPGSQTANQQGNQGGHLNVFYSGKPDEDKEDEDTKV